MEKDWLKIFYSECGREVSLAYNVLNQTNNWAITLVTVFLASIIVSSNKFEGGQIHFIYTHFHWLSVVVSWVILLRFFARSSLALTNMYRWNVLIYASSKVLSLPDNHKFMPIYKRNCAKKIDAYYYRFRSPIPKLKIVWNGLKLMYLWFFIIVLGLYVWGLLTLEKNMLYYLGIFIFLIPTIAEVIWFIKWYGLTYEELLLEEEPEILDSWKITGNNEITQN